MIEILVEEIYSFKGIPVKLGSFHSKLFPPALPQLFLLFFTFLSSYTCRLFSTGIPPLIPDATPPSSASQSPHFSSSLLLLLVL